MVKDPDASPATCGRIKPVPSAMLLLTVSPSFSQISQLSNSTVGLEVHIVSRAQVACVLKTGLVPFSGQQLPMKSRSDRT